MGQDIEKINSSLPIDESIPLQSKARAVQLIGIIVIFLFILLAALGAFGSGILSYKEITANGNTLMYEKYGRHAGENVLTFNLATTDTITQISIPAAYLDYFKIETIVPSPMGNIIANDNYLYYFKGENTKKITFFLLPLKIGTVEGSIKANNTIFKLSQFIYP